MSRIPMQNFKGYCPECPVVALETADAGQVAYGPGAGADATLTVANGPAARNYAEKLDTLGYDYIKTYWQLPVSAWQSFQIESRERGRLPRTVVLVVKWRFR